MSLLSSLIGKPDGNIKAELHLLGKSYSLAQVSLSFNQSVDYNGEPQSEVSGGQILIVLSQIPDNSIISWAVGSRTRRSGEVIFRNETTTPPLRIIFEEAYCVHMGQSVTKGTSVSLTISPKKISLNDVLHDNDWVE